MKKKYRNNEKKKNVHLMNPQESLILGEKNPPPEKKRLLVSVVHTSARQAGCLERRQHRQ